MLNVKGGTHYGYVRDLIISKERTQGGDCQPGGCDGQMGVFTPIRFMVMTRAGILVTTITTCPMGRPTSPICSPMHMVTSDGGVGECTLEERFDQGYYGVPESSI